MPQPRPKPKKKKSSTPAPASPSAVVLLPALRSTFNVDFHHERLGFRVVREVRDQPGGREANEDFDAQGQSTAVSGDCDELARVAHVLSSLQTQRPQRPRTWSEDSSSSSSSSSTTSTGSSSTLNPEGARIARRVKSGDYLVGLNGHSLLGFKFLEIVAIILQTPRPLTLRFWRPPRESHAYASSRAIVSSSSSSSSRGADAPHNWQASGTKHGGGGKSASSVCERSKRQQQHVRRQQPTSLRVPQQSILDEGECRRIAEYLQPSFLKVADWRLLFSTATHGYRYDAVRASGFAPSLLCIRDSNGYVFGAFVNRWNGGMGPVPHTHFFGSGECFLFQARPEFRVFTWTPAAQKANNFDFVLAGDDCLAFGGGVNRVVPRAHQNHLSTTPSANDSPDGSNAISSPGAKNTDTKVTAHAQFGLWLDRDLNKGSSSPCFTFGNPSSLSSQQDFEVAMVELWGFV